MGRLLLCGPLQHLKTKEKTKQQQIYKRVRALKSSLPSSTVFQTNAPIIQAN
jgi:hypothetical protein